MVGLGLFDPPSTSSPFRGPSLLLGNGEIHFLVSTCKDASPSFISRFASLELPCKRHPSVFFKHLRGP